MYLYNTISHHQRLQLTINPGYINQLENNTIAYRYISIGGFNSQIRYVITQNIRNYEKHVQASVPKNNK